MRELQIGPDAPWKSRYRLPQTWTSLARANPTRGLAVSNRSGVYQLYAWEVASGNLTQLTSQPTGKVSGYLAPDGAYVYYLDDQAGNETGHYVRVPFAGGPSEDITPTMPLYSSWSITASLDGSRLGFTTAGEGAYRIYSAPIGPDNAIGAPTLLYETARLAGGPWLSADGTLAVVATTERTGRPEYSLLAFDLASGERIAELYDEDAGIGPFSFSRVAGDTRFVAVTNRSGANRPLVWNVRSGERSDIELPDLQGEVYVRDWSPDGTTLLLQATYQATEQLYSYTLEGGTLNQLQHPAGTFAGLYFAPNNELFAHWEDATHPAQLIALDAATGKQLRVVLPTEGDIPPARPWRSVSFASSDGQMIQGWLALPEGDGPFPTILETHGGPAGATLESYEPGVQCWLDHGFACLSINYRGSTTFGKQFERKIWGDLGHWEVEDMAAARDWLVREGIAQPDAILLTGWSYGGYLTLMGLGKRPELWAGGMAGIAIADWSIQYEDTAETLRGYQVAILGGTPQEKPEQYAASSPITYAERVNAPVLVIQGSNDTRCPPRPLRMYEERLRALGKDIEVHWFEAGHGSYVVEQSIEHQERMLRFAYRVLG